MQINIYTPKLKLGSETKHDLMKQSLIKHLGDSIVIVSEGGGLSINIRPTSDIDLALLRHRAEEAGIKLYFAKDPSLVPNVLVGNAD